jgi:CDP-glucose 4,6-dehydratase
MESMEINFKHKNVLVTGGAGFVGGHLVEELIKQDAYVIIVDILYDKKSYLYTQKLHRQSTLIRLDICNYKKLLAVVKKYKIEFIFHLAAQALVDDAHDNPKKTLENNIVSTINVLEVARVVSKIKGVIVASSDKAYGDLHKKKYSESNPLSGDHPYEVSKSATDLISTSYFKTYGTPVVITRFGNIYGEGDMNFSRIIPGIMKALVNGTQLAIRSNGRYVRDYLHVKDVVDGYMLLAHNIQKVKGEAFNFGSKDTLTVLQVISTIEKIVHKKIKYKILNIAKSEITYQSLNYSKVKKLLGWDPKRTIASSAKGIEAYYRTLLKGLS